MRITIPTTGSRGDVQPYVALGMGLQADGWDVCLATHADFEPFIRSHGLDFHALDESGERMQGSDTGDRMLQSGDNPLSFLAHFSRLRRPRMERLMYNCFHACRGSDVILLSNTELFIGQAVAEKLRLPTCWASLQPTTPSFFLGNFLFPDRPWWFPLPLLYEYSTHAVVGQVFWQWMRHAVNEARRKVLGLRPVLPIGPFFEYMFPPVSLDGYSPLVIPPAPDWGRKHHVTGYWFLNDGKNFKPPADLVAFLAAGSAPIYVGFGSMHNRDPEAVTRLVVEALERSGQRGLLLTGWSGLHASGANDRVFFLNNVPHDWLFPRMAAVVHHGGAGTTSAALRAGVPAVVVPFFSDQPFWARRVNQLGTSPAPVPRALLTAERLGKAMSRAVNDSAMNLRAAEVGRRIRAEDGVGRAVELIDRYYAAGKLRRAPLRRAA
jgi:UDP:flavonoid glycosyltransferase YjiC (YdhE family)